MIPVNHLSHGTHTKAACCKYAQDWSRFRILSARLYCWNPCIISHYTAYSVFLSLTPPSPLAHAVPPSPLLELDILFSHSALALLLLPRQSLFDNPLANPRQLTCPVSILDHRIADRWIHDTGPNVDRQEVTPFLLECLSICQIICKTPKNCRQFHTIFRDSGYKRKRKRSCKGDKI